VIAVETIASIMRFVGLAIVIAGLWFSAGGMRVVVSGRIDERRRSSRSLKMGLPLLVAGLLLLFGSFLLANGVRS
jgi:O-antigen/teichoic acid export membrane protein